MPAEAWTIPALLAQRRAVGADVQAVVGDGEAITWAGLDDASRALAGRLVAAGVGKGDRVGLVMPNGIAWASVAFAVMRIGAVLVPLSTLLRPPELRDQLRVASVAQLIVVRAFRDRSYLDDLHAIAPQVVARTRAGGRDPALPALRNVWLADELPHEDAPASIVAALEKRVRPADDLVILFTSGSSGAPKGVLHTHGSALRATASGLDARCIGAGERLYIPMPFFWTGGFCGGLLSVLLAGATLLTESMPEPERTLRLLERERATLFRGWPDQAARIASHPAFARADLRTLRDASLAPVLPPERRPQPGARANLFGMTETAGPYCGARLDSEMPRDKHGSCGKPFSGIEVRITDPETGAAVAAGVEGEIRLRGPSLMRGVCGRTRDEVLDADGFYPTGDLGRLDAGGWLWFAGRRDDMLKVKGATVYPAEVEGALQSIPGVAQAFVAGVEAADGACEVAALVVAQDDAASLEAAARARLSAFKVPTLWYVVPDAAEVPLSATGKIVKPSLRELLRARGVRCAGRREA